MRFKPFAFRIRVIHDTGAGLHIKHTVFDNGRSNSNGGIHVAIPGQVTHGTGVDAPFDRFEFLNYLHGTHFRRARQGARRECGLQDIQWLHIGFELTNNIRDDMHDMRISLDTELISDINGTCLGNAPDIVAPEVDKHQMLCELFGIFQQFFFMRLVGFFGSTAWACTCQRSNSDFTVFETHENLWRRTNNMMITQVQIEHIGRRIKRTQRPVQIKCRCRKRNGLTLTEYHLHALAGCNVLTYLRDGGFVSFFCKTTDKILLSHFCRAAARFTRWHGCTYLIMQLAKSFQTLNTGFITARCGQHDDGQLATQIVKNDKLIGHH